MYTLKTYMTPVFQASQDTLQAVLSPTLKKLPFNKQSLWQIHHMENHQRGAQSQSCTLWTHAPITHSPASYCDDHEVDLAMGERHTAYRRPFTVVTNQSSRWTKTTPKGAPSISCIRGLISPTALRVSIIKPLR